MLYNNMIIDGMYQVVEEIGSGGMGVIYLAYHLRLQKYIVLKKIKNSNTDITMLRNEADILKSLHHPYLPQVYDFIEYQGNLYTVIDYIDGYDFNYYIQNGYVFSEGQLIKWLRQLCEVLDYLHSQTPPILHTDIKPGNIIITVSGDICLIDFGISLYGTDVIKGLSENYSSPEQYENFHYLQYGTGEYRQLDERTDIYSLGATFYHIMTGIRPDIKDYEQPKISQYALPYSEAFIDIIGSAMEVDRNRRFKSTANMLKAINNMKKHDARYKKYLAAQLLSSLTAAVMIICGVFMMINGYNQGVLSKYEAEYNNFITMADKGDMSGTVAAGQGIINNSEYSRLIDNKTKAQILHKIGDGYFDSGDYYNAAYYYKSVLDYDKSDLHYRDYAFALISDNRTDEAKQVISEINAQYPGSSVITVTDAQLCYRNGEFLQAINKIDSSLNSLNWDTENIYTAFVIKGDSFNALGSFDEAAKAYEAALESKETVTALRKLGNTYLRYADRSLNRSLYKNALNCFKKVYENYSANTDDIVNLAQTYLLAGEISSYNDCKQMLTETAEKYEDCRIYIMLAIVSDATGDPKTETYCQKAHQLYRSLSENDKMMITSSSIKEIKGLYKTYCGQDW